ncbi:MAG: hypothetical protein AAF591_18500 [Verrucomicrobiota bacterium]
MEFGLTRKLVVASATVGMTLLGSVSGQNEGQQTRKSFLVQFEEPRAVGFISCKMMDTTIQRMVGLVGEDHQGVMLKWSERYSGEKVGTKIRITETGVQALVFDDITDVNDGFEVTAIRMGTNVLEIDDDPQRTPEIDEWLTVRGSGPYPSLVKGFNESKTISVILLIVDAGGIEVVSGQDFDLRTMEETVTLTIEDATYLTNVKQPRENLTFSFGSEERVERIALSQEFFRPKVEGILWGDLGESGN